MKRSMYAILAALAALASCSVSANAQTIPIENHYKVYAIQPNPSHGGTVRLDDQWGTSIYDLGQLMFNFANPVSKNGSPVYRPEVHQTWWFLPSNVQDPIRTVRLYNQFGLQSWEVGQSQYLVLPAAKSLTSQPAPLPPNAANHYKCYTATGPAVNVTVNLVDQFGTTVMQATNPALFCNPVAKYLDNGEVSPIVDPTAHLACYELVPGTPAFQSLFATDQFGAWQLFARDTRWLCLPTDKLQTVGVDTNTWGRVKTLYK